jgi:hypothetical protein
MTMDEIKELKKLGFSPEQIVEMCNASSLDTNKIDEPETLDIMLKQRTSYGFSWDFNGDRKIVSVTKGSYADKAGLKIGDILENFDNRKLKVLEDITYAEGMHRFVVKRDGQLKVLKIDYKNTGVTPVSILKKFYKMKYEDQIICAFMTGWKNERANKVFNLSSQARCLPYIVDSYRVLKKGSQTGGADEDKWIYHFDIDGRTRSGIPNKYTLIVRFTTKPTLKLISMITPENLVGRNKLRDFVPLKIDQRIETDWNFNYPPIDYSLLVE